MTHMAFVGSLKYMFFIMPVWGAILYIISYTGQSLAFGAAVASLTINHFETF